MLCLLIVHHPLSATLWGVYWLFLEISNSELSTLNNTCCSSFAVKLNSRSCSVSRTTDSLSVSSTHFSRENYCYYFSSLFFIGIKTRFDVICRCSSKKKRIVPSLPCSPCCRSATSHHPINSSEHDLIRSAHTGLIL